MDRLLHSKTLNLCLAIVWLPSCQVWDPILKRTWTWLKECKNLPQVCSKSCMPTDSGTAISLSTHEARRKYLKPFQLCTLCYVIQTDSCSSLSGNQPMANHSLSLTSIPGRHTGTAVRAVFSKNKLQWSPSKLYLLNSFIHLHFRVYFLVCT